MTKTEPPKNQKIQVGVHKVIKKLQTLVNIDRLFDGKSCANLKMLGRI